MKKNVCFLSLLLILADCAPLEENVPGASIDLIPPVLERVTTTGVSAISFLFNEAVTLENGSLEFSPDLAPQDIQGGERELLVTTTAEMEIGREYTCRLSVRDCNGNGTWIVARFFGHNPRPPRILINEFTTQGSATHPDLIELKILSAGDMGGIAFFHGTRTRFACRLTFPSFTVASGDFILLHVKPENTAAEIDETAGDKSVSGGIDASNSAYDLWVKGGTGLSGNNGIVSIYSQPDGDILDAVIYSNRNSGSDTDYRGFGSLDFMKQADELVAAGGWIAATGQARPEDAVNPEDSTATRSLCRSRSSADTDSLTDFHVVPTRCASFGADNTDEIYVP